jgi:hypothetical protein
MTEKDSEKPSRPVNLTTIDVREFTLCKVLKNYRSLRHKTSEFSEGKILIDKVCLSVNAMSKLMNLHPASLDELQDFAYTLGEHTEKFSSHLQYKQFVQDLLSDVIEGLPKADVSAVRDHIERLAIQRAREEKSGNVSHFLQKRDNDDEGQVGDDVNAYIDFM